MNDYEPDICKLYTFEPNPKQLRFLNSHATEVFLTGPNQYGGKTFTLRCAVAAHASGRYPQGWAGPRATKPGIYFVFSKTASSNRIQMIEPLIPEVFGMTHIHGAGWIHPDDYDVDQGDVYYGKLGVPFIKVDFQDGDGNFVGKSAIYFLSYEMGWKSVAGFTANGVFGNETPPPDVYTEMKARINATKGRLMIAACPLEEDPIVYYQFKDAADGRFMELIEYTIDDCTHLTQDEYDEAIGRWANHPEAEARLYGRPCRAAGLVFAYPPTKILVPPEDPKGLGIIGLDLPHGVGHFAAVRGIYDPTRDRVLIDREFKALGTEIPLNAKRVKQMEGDMLPVTWPHDGAIRVSTGETIAEMYRQAGLNMLPEPAYFWDGTKRSKDKLTMVTEAQERFSTGRLVISQMCPQLFREIQSWRFRNGKIMLEQDDHLIDAMLKILMSLRYAQPIGGGKRPAVIRRSDYDFYSLSGP